MTARIGAVFVQSTDPLALARWYAKALGLPAPEAMTNSSEVGFTLGSVYLGFDNVTETAGRGATTVWFAVDDATAVARAMESTGAAVVREPEVCGDEVLGELRDYEGNAIGLIGRVQA